MVVYKISNILDFTYFAVKMSFLSSFTKLIIDFPIDLYPLYWRNGRPGAKCSTLVGPPRRESFLLRKAYVHDGGRTSVVHQTATVYFRRRTDFGNVCYIYLLCVYETV